MSSEPLEAVAGSGTAEQPGRSRLAPALLFPFALGALLLACAPSREAMTAGEIGVDRAS